MPKRSYLPRIIDARLIHCLELFGAVEVAGTKWSGKTRCAQQVCRSETAIAANNAELYQTEPALALMGVRPHLVDEWQDAPAIWDATRKMVDDEDGEPGLVVLTGSSSPGHGDVQHDGAGRIARLRMRPMSLAESGESSGEVSLTGLFDGVFFSRHQSRGHRHRGERRVPRWVAAPRFARSDGRRRVREAVSRRHVRRRRYDAQTG